MTTGDGRIVTTDAEIDQALARAQSQPQHIATRAHYQANEDLIVVQLEGGVVIGFPRAHLQGLESASPAELDDIELEGGVTGLFWPRLDVAHFLPGLIDGVFGTRKWMADLGRRGGAVKSERKSLAVRENGKKGGRPSKIAASVKVARASSVPAGPPESKVVDQ